MRRDIRRCQGKGAISLCERSTEAQVSKECRGTHEVSKSSSEGRQDKKRKEDEKRVIQMYFIR